MSLLSQPDSILTQICGQLDTVSLLTTLCTCKRLRGVVLDIVKLIPCAGVEGLQTQIQWTSRSSISHSIRYSRANSFIDIVRVVQYPWIPAYLVDILVGSMMIHSASRDVEPLVRRYRFKFYKPTDFGYACRFVASARLGLSLEEFMDVSRLIPLAVRLSKLWVSVEAIDIVWGWVFSYTIRVVIGQHRVQLERYMQTGIPAGKTQIELCKDRETYQLKVSYKKLIIIRDAAKSRGYFCLR